MGMPEESLLGVSLPPVYQSLFAATEEVPEAVTIKCPSTISTGRLMVFTAKLFGREVRILLDSGASSNFIDTNFCRSRGYRTQKLDRERRIKLANDTTLISSEILPKAQFKYAGFKDQQDLQLLDTKGMFQVIFGQPFLLKHNPVIDWVQRTITIQRTHNKNTTGEMQSRTMVAIETEEVNIDMLNCMASSDSEYDTWAYSCHNSRCTCYTAVDDSMDACTVCAPVAYPVPSENIPAGEPMDNFDDTGEYLLSAKQFAKTMKQTARNAPKNSNPMAHLVLLSPEGTFDFSMVQTEENPDLDIGEKSLRQRYEDRLREKYQDRFKQKLGKGVPPVRWPNAQMNIDLELGENSPPVTSPYKLNRDQLLELKKQLAYYIDVGFLRPSSSPYASPVLFVPKTRADGTFDGWRFCCDYRKLNKYTRRDMTPLPPIDQIIEQLAGAKIFSKIDLTQYYHQIPINPADIEKTAITTKYGNYEWTVVPFGLTNAPAVAVRIGNRLLYDFIDNFIIIFMDDILVYSKSIEEHAEHLDKIMERMQQYDFYLHPGKCTFFLDTVRYTWA